MELRQRMNGFIKEFEAFKYKMTWRSFHGDRFDKSKEYRIQLNSGGGWIHGWYHDSKQLFFDVSSSSRVFGCIEITNLKQWHYRIRGNSAKKPNGHDNNGSVNSVEERG